MQKKKQIQNPTISSQIQKMKRTSVGGNVLSIVRKSEIYQVALQLPTPPALCSHYHLGKMLMKMRRLYFTFTFILMMNKLSLSSLSWWNTFTFIHHQVIINLQVQLIAPIIIFQWRLEDFHSIDTTRQAFHFSTYMLPLFEFSKFWFKDIQWQEIPLHDLKWCSETSNPSENC